jgi:hypothetical protein
MLGWLVTFAVLLRVLVVALPIASTFVVVTALTAGTVESALWRVAIGAAASLGLPLVVRWRAARWLATRRKQSTPPSADFCLAVGNLAILCALSLGFADDTGRALRRHGDWFLGERNGAVARHVRTTVGFVSGYLEDFDPHAAFAEADVPLAPPTDVPPGSGVPPPVVPVAAVAASVWYHPLMGPERQLPGYASRRFGASRAVIRPPECELGHCGVDIGSTIGDPVLSIYDGVVDRVQRNPNADPISGIFLIVSHKHGAVRSRYIHLDSIREDLVVGSTVHGGEMIGRLGRTGVRNSAAHLHFGLSVREGGRERFIDPEPYLREWQLVDRDDSRPQLARRL